MNRRRFLDLSGKSLCALSLGAGDFVFPGTGALARVGPAEAARALDALRREGPLRAAVRVERGGPRLFLNGEEAPPLFGLSTSLLPTAAGYRRMGLRMLQPQLGLASAWKGPGVYDFSRLEAYLGQLLAVVPDALFFPRLQLQTPIWWKEAHPDEMIVYGLEPNEAFLDVIRKKALPLAEGDHHFTNFYGEAWEASYASEPWKRDTTDMLRAFVRHIEDSPLASRFVGYFFVHGRTEEWNHPGGDWMPDYSRPMQEAMGPLPSPRDRLYTHYGLFRDPATEGHVIDFYRRFHELRAGLVAHFAEAVKAEMDGRALCGTFFGYLMEAPRLQESGHLAPRAVLDSPHIDVIACPYAYQATNEEGADRRESDLYDGAGNWLGRARGLGGDGGFRAMVASIRRRGKLYVSEVDPSTYLDAENRWRGIGGTGSDTLEGSRQILRRDLGRVFAEGVGGWLYDFGPYHGVETGWYGSDEMIETIGEMVDLIERRKDLDLSSVAEVALVGDADAFFATRHWLASRPWPGQGIRYSDFINHWYLDAQQRALSRLGAPADLLHRFDLTADDVRRYRLLLFPTAFLLAPADVDALHALLRGSGATAVWYHAPGLLAPGGVDLAQMERLTGFACEELDDPGPLMIRAEDRENAPAERFGVMSPEYYQPRFAVTDPDAEVLGRWTAPGKPAFARKAMDGWTSVYVGTGPLPAEWLRKLAAEAGARLWTDRPAVVAGTRGAAMVVATEAGPHQVSLPHAMTAEGETEARTLHDLGLGFGDVLLFTAS